MQNWDTYQKGTPHCVSAHIIRKVQIKLNRSTWQRNRCCWVILRLLLWGTVIYIMSKQRGRIWGRRALALFQCNVDCMRMRNWGWHLVSPLPNPLLTTPSNINYSTLCVVVAARQWIEVEREVGEYYPSTCRPPGQRASSNFCSGAVATFLPLVVARRAINWWQPRNQLQFKPISGSRHHTPGWHDFPASPLLQCIQACFYNIFF